MFCVFLGFPAWLFFVSLPPRNLFVDRPFSLDLRGLFRRIATASVTPVAVEGVGDYFFCLEYHVDEAAERPARARRFVVKGVVTRVRCLLVLRSVFFLRVNVLPNLRHDDRVSVFSARPLVALARHLNVSANGSNGVRPTFRDRLRYVPVLSVGHARKFAVKIRVGDFHARCPVCVGCRYLCFLWVVICRAACRFFPSLFT